MKTGTIPTRTRNAIWEVLLIHSMDSLIEGYSNIKRVCISVYIYIYQKIPRKFSINF